MMWHCLCGQLVVDLDGKHWWTRTDNRRRPTRPVSNVVSRTWINFILRYCLCFFTLKSLNPNSTLGFLRATNRIQISFQLKRIRKKEKNGVRKLGIQIILIWERVRWNSFISASSSSTPAVNRSSRFGGILCLSYLCKPLCVSCLFVFAWWSVLKQKASSTVKCSMEPLEIDDGLTLLKVCQKLIIVSS